MKHTPGPWNALAGGTQSKCRWWIQGPETNEEGFRNIANVAVWGSAEMQEANARLIAASPELYQCVGDFVLRFGYYVECDEAISGADAVDWISQNMRDFRSALNKARGLL